MKSYTKCTLSKEQIDIVSYEVWGEECLTYRELSDGWFNSAYMLETLSGQRGVLKVAPNSDVKVMSYEENIMSVEVDVMRIVKGKTDVPVPQILRYDNTLSRIPNEYFVMEVLDGQPFNKVKEQLSANVQNDIIYQLGQYNKQINEITNDKFGLYQSKAKKYDKWSDCFIDMVEMLLKDGKENSVDLGISYEDAWKLIISQKDKLDVVTTPRLVHWDLWDGNIFVRDKEIVGIIDFERSLWGDRLMEVYFHSSISPNFLAGYDIDMSTEKFAEIRMALYALYVALVMVIECSYRGFSNEHFEWAQGRLKEKLEFVKSIVISDIEFE